MRANESSKVLAGPRFLRNVPCSPLQSRTGSASHARGSEVRVLQRPPPKPHRHNGLCRSTAASRFPLGAVLGRSCLRPDDVTHPDRARRIVRRRHDQAPQLEDFHVSGERVIEVDLCGKATWSFKTLRAPVVQVLAVLLCRRPFIIAFVAPVGKVVPAGHSFIDSRQRSLSSGSVSIRPRGIIAVRSTIRGACGQPTTARSHGSAPSHRDCVRLSRQIRRQIPPSAVSLRGDSNG